MAFQQVEKKTTSPPADRPLYAPPESEVARGPQPVTICQRGGVPLNALTIDLEDWAQSTLGPDTPITERVLRNTDRMLELFARHQVRATFFALGKVCEKFPTLLPKVAAAGHEIGTHGYGHEHLRTIDARRFREDLHRSIELIADQIGCRPIGYRAPEFSVVRETLWAGPVLAELGIKYSSSIFPIDGRRYGIPDAPRFPYRWANCDLIEFPLTTFLLRGRRLPISGGGYFRLLPGPVIVRCFRRIARSGRPVVVYVHPYELDVNELRELRQQGWSIGRKTYITQSLFRSRMQGRLSRVMTQFPFASMSEVLGLE